MVAKLGKILLSLLLVALGLNVPVAAAPISISGKVTASITAANGLSLVGTVVQLEKYDSDADTYTPVTQATATPSPAATSTAAPYKFENVDDGTYRVTYPLKFADVATSKFASAATGDFVVADGKITVADKPATTIPELRLTAMGWFAIQAIDALNNPIPNAVISLSGQFNSEDAEFPNLVEANSKGTATFPIPNPGLYSVKISDPSGFNQDLIIDRNFGGLSTIGNRANVEKNPTQYTLLPAGLLSVTVTSAQGKVAGAIVHLLNADDEVGVATAGADGVATIKGVAPGDYSMWAGGPMGSVLRDSDAKDVSITAGQITNATQNLVAGLTISGSVFGSTDKLSSTPISNVRIDVEQVGDDGSESPMSPAQTESDGSYTTNGLSAGTYNLYFFDESSDWQNYRLSGSIMGVVVGKTNVTKANLTLTSASIISGTVVNQLGKPLANVNVELTNAYGDSAATTTSDETGQYQFTRVVVGGYSLKFTNDNYRTSYSQDFETLPNAISVQDITLNSGSGISGKVIAAISKQGINGLQVSVFAADGAGTIPVSTTLTQADGSYSFNGLPAGSYRVKFDGSSASPTTDVFWQPAAEAQANANSFGRAADILTRPGYVTNNVNPVPVTPWGLVTGRIVNNLVDPNTSASAAPVEGATVTLVATDGSLALTDESDTDGNFSAAAPDGTYVIKIAAAGFATGYVGDAGDGSPSIVSSLSSAAKVNVVDGKATFANNWDIANWSVDVSGSGGSVKVTVSDDTDSPVSDGFLIAYDAQGNAAAFTDQCDDNGTFVLNGLRGSYTFGYDSPGEYVKSFVGGTFKYSDPGTTVGKLQDGKTLSYKLSVKSLPNLNFKLVTDNSTSAPLYTEDTTIEVYTFDGENWLLNDDLSSGTNDGTVSIGVTNGASYRVRVVPESGALAAVWLGGAPYANRVEDAATITMPSVGKPPAIENVVLNVYSGVISGVVTDNFGGQVSNAQVQLLDGAGEIIAKTETREDGIYKFYRVVPGVYSLKFMAEGLGIKYANDVKVQGGQTTQLSMTLNEASGITGLMLSDDGSPVVGATVSIYLAGGSGVTPLDTVQTLSDGSYNFMGLPAATYKLEFDGTTAKVPTDDFWYSDSANVANFKLAGEIQTTLGAYLKNIDPKPSKSWALIKGTITNSSTALSGAAVSLVTVSLETVSGRVVATSLTDDNGNFALYAPDGSYQIKVEAAGFAAGYIDTTGTDSIALTQSPVDAAIVSVKDNVALITGGPQANNLLLDLSGTGGTLTVTVKDDNGSVVTTGEVTVYDASGNIAGYDDQPLAGAFNIAGLNGNYRVSYELPGTYAKTFYGGTSDVSDPKTLTLAVSKTASPSAVINVKALPKLTVKIVGAGANAPAFKQPATVEVYTAIDDQWTLNSELTQDTYSGQVTFGVAAGDQYRIRVVPNSEYLAPVWVGGARLAKSVEYASTITIPDSGVVPVLGNVVLDTFAGTVEGYVLDQDAAAIANASVILLDATGTEIDATSTRSDGGYRFAQELQGTYTLKIVADGYAIKYLKKFEIKANEVRKDTTQLTPATGISGRVYLSNANNDPVVDGSVSVYAASGTGSVALQTVQTDENGDYNFVGLPAGDYKIFFDNSTAKIPSSSYWYGVTANAKSFQEASSVQAVIGQYASGIDPFATEPWTLFTGNIHDGSWAVSGGSVSLVSVSLISVAGKASLTGLTDEFGNFAIYAPNGAYRIKVEAPGYQIGFVDATESGTPVLNTSGANAAVLYVSDGVLEFDSGIKETSLSLDLGTSGGNITVTIKDEEGQSVSEGLVNVYDKTGQVIAFDNASVGGVFTIKGLRGTYRVSYQQDGVFAETFLGDTTSIGAPGTKAITVNNGSQLALTIKVKTLPKLTINLYSSGTTPYQQPVMVEVYSQQEDSWILDEGLTQETSDGRLTIGVANLSQYRIRLVPLDPALAPVWLGANPTAQSVNLAKSVLIPASGAIPAVSGRLDQAASTLSGKVSDSFQNLLTGVSVELLATNGEVVAETTTLEDGTYTFVQLVPGSYKVKFGLEKFASKSYGVTLSAGSAVVQDATLDSASGISGQVLGSGLKQAFQILGGPRQNFQNSDALNPGNVPVSGAVVGLYLASGNGLTPVRTEITDEAGYFNFSGLVPGSYRIRVDGTVADKPAERVWYADSQSNALSFETATTIEAKRNELVTNINPAPIKFWTLFDGLIKAGDSSVPNASISLVTDSGNTYEGVTDGDGFFTVFAPDGTYKVQVSAAGYPVGYISDLDTGAVLDPNTAKATILTVANSTAQFSTGLDLMSTPLDLAAFGGNLAVSVLDGTTVLTNGVVTVYNRAGAQIAFSDAPVGGTFNFAGLRGDYKVSYEQAGSYALTFLGGTSSAVDPATLLVKVRDKATTNATISAIALPKLTVSIKSGNTAYQQPVAVSVYQLIDNDWQLNEELSGSTFTGSYTFGVGRGESYRVQVVPDDATTASAWVGSTNALTVTDAQTYTIPAKGSAPVLPAVSLMPAVKVVAQFRNSLPSALANVSAHLEVTVNSKFVDFSSQELGTLEADETSSLTFDRVPSSMFPVRIVGSSSNSADTKPWTSSGGTPTSTVTSNVLEFNEAAVLAKLSGTLKTVDGQGIANQAINLVTDDGETYGTATTNDSGNYSFVDLPLGVHFAVNIEPESGFITPDSESEFSARSGDVLTLDFTAHYSVKFAGIVYDANGQTRPNALVNVFRVTGSTLDINNDDSFEVYTDDAGNWSFDGAEFNAEVGNYAFYVDGLDSDFTPAYLGSSDCVNKDTLPEFKATCAVTKAADALVVKTDKDVQSTNVTLSLGAPDNSAPSGVKIAKAPTATTITDPTWTWVGNDKTDGKSLRSQVVIASAPYGQAMSAWSSPIDVTGTSYTIKGIRGTTYCFAVSMVDKSSNASAYTAPSCTTMAMDDTAMKPAKAALWTKVALKGAYLGKVTATKKNVKNAVLNITKAAAGKSLCIYYATGPKSGTFVVAVNGKKLGKPIKTKGKAGQITSVCYTTKLKANSKITITVPKAGSGVQIDGYAITIAKPASPPAPISNLKAKQ